ncbi:hypothetical protein [Brevundimonas guildfordensis]|uniref:hypothetical protein n=1 Tax=Brevundimonas guildfordensis TaxID=2762241 RepID=UPI001CD82ABD|nr:hypothetical protein [Brevundimonas guildfordensis]
MIALTGALALSACASPPPAARPATAPQAVAQAQQSQPVGTRMPQSDADICKAGEFQWLVGKPRSEIPVPVDVVNRRVACTTCPVTEDYSPYRLNIFYNQQTGLVEQVRCG